MKISFVNTNPIHDGPFIAARGWERSPLSKICHAYPAKMTVNLTLRKSKKYMNHVTQHVFTGNQQFLLYQEVEIKIT